MTKILEVFKWFCTLWAIATVAVVSVGSLWDKSVGNTIDVVFACIFGLLTFCAAFYWAIYCIGRMFGVFDKAVEEELKEDKFDF